MHPFAARLFQAGKIGRLACALAVAAILFQPAACSEERFGGLGLNVAQLLDPAAPEKQGELVVLDVLANTPARAAGIMPGDVITAIDGFNVRGQEFERLILEKMRGPEGSTVVLTVKRARGNKTFRTTIKRVGLSN